MSKPAITEEEKSFWAAVNGGKNFTAVAAFADWCEENDKKVLAAALRYCAKFKRWPKAHYNSYANRTSYQFESYGIGRHKLYTGYGFYGCYTKSLKLALNWLGVRLNRVKRRHMALEEILKGVI